MRKISQTKSSSKRIAAAKASSPKQPVAIDNEQQAQSPALPGTPRASFLSQFLVEHRTGGAATLQSLTQEISGLAEDVFDVVGSDSDPARFPGENRADVFTRLLEGLSYEMRKGPEGVQKALNTIDALSELAFLCSTTYRVCVRTYQNQQNGFLRPGESLLEVIHKTADTDPNQPAI